MRILLIILSLILIITLLFFIFISPLSLKTYLYSFQKKGKIFNLKNLLQECAEYLYLIDCNYQISDGTLLGIIREGDLIQWDDDVDIIIFDTDEKYFIECMRKKFGKRFHVGRGIHRLFNHNHQYIDFYIYTIEENTVLPKGPFLKFLSNNFKPSKHLILHKYDKNCLLPTRQVQWNNTILNIPNQPINILEKHYGKDWMIPKKW